MAGSTEEKLGSAE